MTETQPTREEMMESLRKLRENKKVSIMRVSNDKKELVKSVIEQDSVIIEEKIGRGCTGYVFSLLPTTEGPTQTNLTPMV